MQKTVITAEFIAESIRNEILQGKRKGGEPLRQDEIASRFSVSKIPVREALVQLKSEGLVSFVQNKGAAVSSLSADEVDEIYTIRSALETIALQRAIPHLTIADLAKAETIIQQIDSTQTVSDWGRLNWTFHAILYAPAKMPRLIETVESLHTNVSRYLVLYLAGLNYQAQSQLEHRQILDACRQGEVETAVSILQTHLEAASKKLVAFLNESEK